MPSNPRDHDTLDGTGWRGRDLEAALRSLNWEIDGPKQTVSGWKATIRRGTLSILMTGQTAEQVLEALLGCAQEHAEKEQP